MTYIHSGQISLIDMGKQYVLTSSNEDQTVKVFDKRTAKCIQKFSYNSDITAIKLDKNEQ